MATYKREWHFQYFNSCAEFEAWQAAGAYGRNITSIVPLPVCSGPTNPDAESIQYCARVMVTWWISPPGNAEGHGTGPGVSPDSGPDTLSGTA